MVLFFSGTGNSRLVAKIIAETAGDKLVSINEMMKEKINKTISSSLPLVFVAPVYAFRLPHIVEQFIRETQFEGSRSAYFVLTAGSSAGNAAHYAQQLCGEKGFDFQGLAQVIMPENYIAMYPVPNMEEARKIINEARPRIAQIAELIKGRKPLPEKKASLIEKLISGPLNTVFYPLFVSDRGFRVLDKCISCGKCERRCPLNNIAMESGKPIWQGNCTHCMACICCCPVEAIEYKKKSLGKPRYDIMEGLD